MTTQQPKWKCVAQLGDASPVEYGGYWIFVDETGVYPPEAELLVTPLDDEERGRHYREYRFVLEPCTYANGILSDNPFHPDHAAWFAKPERELAERPHDTTYLKDVADFIGMETDELIALFLSDVPVDRAVAWRAVGEYHGFSNLDSYPLEMTLTEARRRYKLARYKIKA